MKDQVYTDAPFVSLSEFIQPARFRTVLEAQKDLFPGRSEIQVRIELAGRSPNRAFLPEVYKNSMFVFGFVQNNQRLSAVFSGKLAEDYLNRHILLVDWVDKFLLIFENGTRTAEQAYSVTADDFQALMQHCLHPNITAADEFESR